MTTTEDISTSSKWASRKFALCVGIALIITALLWWGKIDQNVYQTLIIFISTGYLAANASQAVLMSKENKE